MISLKKLMCRVLAVSMLALSIQSAQAGMIGADAAAGHTTSAERVALASMLDRSEIASRLVMAGVDPVDAKARLSAMTDQEVRTMASDLSSAPAGADGGWAVGAIVLVFLIWYIAFRK